MKVPSMLLSTALSAPLAMLVFFDFVLSRPNLLNSGYPPTGRLSAAAARPTASPPPHLALPPASHHPPPAANYAPFKPSVAVIVAVLTTIFSITFLLLLYAKHCKRGDGGGVVGYFGGGDVPYYTRGGGRGTVFAAVPVPGRKNSGIDRAVIESLPVFRFASLSGEKDGLECAVCLNRFEPVEVLRLLPKCKHAFHVECVDTWLDAHSTCPLCRYRVDPEDVLLVETGNHPIIAGFIPEEDDLARKPSAASSESTTRKALAEPIRRISGRHSYAGISSSKANPPAFRMSYDGLQRKRAVETGCFDRHRKDGMLLTAADRERERRLEHRIVIAGEERWSDIVQPSAGLLYLPRESVMKGGRRSSADSSSKGDHVVPQRRSKQRSQGIDDEEGGGRVVINGGDESEITGLRQERPSNSDNGGDKRR